MQGRVPQTSALNSLGQNQLYMLCAGKVKFSYFSPKRSQRCRCAHLWLWLSNSPWSASAPSCLSVHRVGTTRTHILFHWASVPCPSMLTFPCSFHGCCQRLLRDEVTVCFDHGQKFKHALVFMQLPLGPQIEPLEHPSVSTELELRFGWELTTLFFAYRKIRHYVSISRLCNDNNKVSENSAMLTLVWALSIPK